MEKVVLEKVVLEKIVLEKNETATQARWNSIYKERREQHNQSPAAVLIENRSLLTTTQGLALDVACGTGTNAIYLASLGYRVEAWDISDVAIEQLAQKAKASGAAITGICCNITPRHFEGRQFDLVLNCHYLDRTLLPAMLKAIRPGGLLCFQTFSANKQIDFGPKNPGFLLAPGELKSWLTAAEILAERNADTSLDEEDPLAGREYIIARLGASA